MQETDSVPGSAEAQWRKKIPVLWRALNTIGLDSVSTGDPLDRVESQSPGLSYVPIAKSVMPRVV